MLQQASGSDDVQATTNNSFECFPMKKLKPNSEEFQQAYSFIKQHGNYEDQFQSATKAL